MKSLYISLIGNRKTEIFEDEGRYYLHLYEDGKMQRNLFFPVGYTYREIEKRAKEWTENESKVN